MRSKYGNKKVFFDGRKFDSKLEMERWLFLKDAERRRQIRALRQQVRIPCVVNGQKVCDYVADFCYELDGREVVEDTKGYLTDVFKIKAKLVRAVHGFEIRIVKKPTEKI